MVKVTDINKNKLRVNNNASKIESLARDIFRNTHIYCDTKDNTIFIENDEVATPVIAEIDINNHSMTLCWECYFGDAMTFAEKYERQFLADSNKKEFEIITDYR